MSVDPNQIKDLEQVIPKSTLELLLNPIAQEIGYSLGGLYYAIFGKLIRYGAVKKAETDALIKQVSEKYTQIPEERRTDANKGLIFKAFEDSRYSLSSEELRNLFANLIANSTDSKYLNKNSPYFSTVLKNLSVNEALFLNKFKYTQSIAITKVRFTDSKDRQFFTDYKQDYVLNKNDNPKKETVSIYSKEIDTLESLGIVRRKYGQFNNSERNDLSKIKKHINNKHLEKNLNGHFELDINSKKRPEIFLTQHQYDTVNIIPGSLELTELGQSFVEIIFA
ncbi:Abi-alpha family protein [Limosilactobacillus ingluviei]|uniref:Abi-alpha family protein n=1 Tax=Limosilactobacillus ingluviei TaxID=148604 RepID=UPI0005944B6B|nr:Abi-alpha family protein [Limosilactobacillus ingluviei]